ncbi:MAG: CPBP family intramembrane metalloprotease [Planctomycetes bacterium]|nr:CPBP family intramembrane metalloprotease [Planctomycetota bacterium]MCA8936949.1 CPBP family intramembrane metalloprotease [Planctomycetota bacterium]
MGATWIEQLLEPERVELAANSHAMAFGLAMLGACVGVVVLFLLIRRFGQADSGLSRSEAVFAFPLGIAAFILPAVFIIALKQNQPTGDPLTSAAIQTMVAAVCIFALANHPWRPGDEQRGSWYRADARQLRWIPLVFLLALPVMQLGMFASVQLHEWLSAPVVQQGVVEQLRASRSARGMTAWYLMAVVAAPVMEEFVFRVALFGGTRRLLAGISDAQGWKHPGAWIALGFSVGVFVLAHGVWGWTVGIIPLTMLSLILTFIYAHTRSIWPGMLYHAIHNAFVVTMQYFVLT